MFACIHAPDAGALAGGFSPWVEMVDEKTALFSITPRQLAARGLERIPAQTAVASTAEAALLAARNLPGYTYIEPGRETEILGSLSIDTLPPEPEVFETLDRWGIRTLADLARLPEHGLAERLGERGLLLQQLARGALARPLRPLIPAAVYQESIELDHPLELREPLMFLIARFLNEQCARLKSQSLAASSLDLTINGDQKRRSLVPFPTRDVKLLLKLAEHSLERDPPREPIAKLHLELIPAQPRRVQQDLFIPAAPEPEKLELTLGKIRGLVGEKNVGPPELFDTYRPGAGRNLPFLPALAFRCFRPPLAARVEVDAGTPKRLSTRMFHGNVTRAAGPWRSSGDWWRPDVWDRDEWDVALSGGGLYRLYLDRASRQWFVEGTYD
jgi:protein ImuB